MGFNRFAVCLAFWAYMVDWHYGGVTERDQARQRRLRNGQLDTISNQLHRMKFRPSPMASTDPDEFEDEVSRETYWGLVERYEGAELVPDDYRRITTQLPIVVPDNYDQVTH